MSESVDGARGTRVEGVATWARAAGVAVYLGGFGFLLIGLWQVLLLELVGVDDSSSVAWQLVGQLAILLGAGTLAALFVRQTDRDLSFLDLEWPGGRALAIAVGGVLALLALNSVAEVVGVPVAGHAIEDQLADNPAAALWLVAGSLLFVGPGEELLYRNVVQKVVAERLGAPAAIVVASVVFAAVHVFAYLGAPTAAFLGTLGLVFGLSVVLGAIYEYTGSLVAVALTHGGYDAVVFATLYLELAG